jgi:lysophospholipase L1-like esterase
MSYFKFFFLLIPFVSFSQRENLELKPTLVENSLTSLSNIKQKIDSLKQGLITKVSILHVGDSHIQPDNLSGFVRKKMQSKYGNGGRGLVFPYATAKTFGPEDFSATSSSSWSSSWIIHYPHKFKMGLPSIAIRSNNEIGNLSIELKKDSIINPYTKGFLLYSMSDNVRGKIRVNGKFEKANSRLDFDTLNFFSKDPQSKLELSFSGSSIVLEGIYFENDSPGIIYNSSGVAGARYQDYLANDLFFQQLPYFKPDLLIISLGTNEAYDLNFSKEKFEAILDSTYTKIKEKLPNTSILITLPSETYKTTKAGVVENEKITIISEILKAKCNQYNFAFWDLFEAMGGKGSMLTWKKNQLVTDDYIHFLNEGYQLQGELLFEALEGSFE